MNIEITVVNGKQFVSGLRWHKLRLVRSHKKEAREISKREGWDMVTIRRTRTSIMAGYAPRGRQGLKGMYSLAACLGTQLGDNWVGIFSVGENRYALAAVNQGEVMPLYDQVGSFEEINSLARECYAVASSNDASDAPRSIRTIAPPEFRFGDDCLELKDVLVPRAVRREHKLRPVKFGVTRAQLMVYGGAALVIGGVSYGGKAWWEANRHAQEVALAKQQLAEEQKRAARQVQEVVHPWEQKPRAEVVVEACSAHLQITPISIGGWVFASSSCTPGSAKSEYSRNPEVNDKLFIREANRVTGAPPVMGKNGASINLARSMTPSGKEPLREFPSVVLDLSSDLSKFQGTAFQLSPATEQAQPAEEKPANPWMESGFEITSPWPPQQLFVGMDTAGIRIESIETKLASDSGELTWTLKGTIYGNP